MTAMRSFKPTICPSGTSREEGSRDLEAPGRGIEAGSMGAAFCGLAAAFSARVLPGFEDAGAPVDAAAAVSATLAPVA